MTETDPPPVVDPPPVPSTEIVPVPRESKTPVAIGIAPATLDEAWRLAQNLSRSGLVPKAYQGKPSDVLVAVLMGAEVGLSPTTALQSIAVVNGRPGLYGDGLLAVVTAAPSFAGRDAYLEVESVTGAPLLRVDALTADDLKRDTTRAVAEFRRRGHADPFVATFSIADAKRAGLWTKEGPWQTYPQRMLLWRAIDFAARAAFPDVLKGIRSALELADLPVDPDPAPAPAPPVVRRRSAPPVEDDSHD